MCGRFVITSPPAAIRQVFGYAEQPNFPPRFNIAPTQPVPVVILDQGARHFRLMRWGLVPAWVKDPRQVGLLFNARSEGVLDKASFKTAMRHRRALVPASGFYEWQQSGGARGQPYWVRPRHGRVIALAGLVETYAEPGGSEMDTGAILTTRASASIAHIHDRMPVVIEERDFARWLDCRTQEPRDVLDLLKPAKPDFFEAVPVSDLVNKVANTGPEIQERGIVSPQAERVRRQKPGADEDQMTLF